MKIVGLDKLDPRIPAVGKQRTELSTLHHACKRLVSEETSSVCGIPARVFSAFVYSSVLRDSNAGNLALFLTSSDVAGFQTMCLT